MGLNGFIFRKINKNLNIKEKKKPWEQFRICLLNSTANPANFHPKWAGLVVLFSKQILNSSWDFFHFDILIFIYFFKYEIIETHARAFFTFIILGLATCGKVPSKIYGKYLIMEKNKTFFGLSIILNIITEK